MGCYDSVIVCCPSCGEQHELQSKSGDCFLEVYTLENCPYDVLQDINRHAPFNCECGITFNVDKQNRKLEVLNFPEGCEFCMYGKEKCLCLTDNATECDHADRYINYEGIECCSDCPKEFKC